MRLSVSRLTVRPVRVMILRLLMGLALLVTMSRVVPRSSTRNRSRRRRTSSVLRRRVPAIPRLRRVSTIPRTRRVPSSRIPVLVPRLLRRRRHDGRGRRRRLPLRRVVRADIVPPPAPLIEPLGPALRQTRRGRAFIAVLRRRRAIRARALTVRTVLGARGLRGVGALLVAIAVFRAWRVRGIRGLGAVGPGGGCRERACTVGSGGGALWVGGAEGVGVLALVLVGAVLGAAGVA